MLWVLVLRYNNKRHSQGAPCISECPRPIALHSVDEVCQRLRMSRPTFYRKYADGTAPRTTRYGRWIFISDAALEAYLAQHSEPDGAAQ
jgi:excisionase family DNA binding protein